MEPAEQIMKHMPWFSLRQRKPAIIESGGKAECSAPWYGRSAEECEGISVAQLAWCFARYLQKFVCSIRTQAELGIAWYINFLSFFGYLVSKP